MRKPLICVLPILILTSLILSGVCYASELESVDLRTVRVGYYHAEGYHVMDADGGRSGYGYEVLQAMKLYNNWVYEYVGYDKGWADIQKMLKAGEIDMVVSAVKTPARELEYDFSERAIAQSGACLMVKAGESPYMAGNYADYNGMRVGFIEGASQIASMSAFALEHGFSYLPVYYKTSDELENALLAGAEVDAIVTSNMRIIEGSRRLDLFAMQDVHVMVRKGDSELLNEINYALEQISLYSPNLYDSLYNKYYSVDAGDRVFFTPEESRYIAELTEKGVVINVTLTPDIAPYAYYDGGAPSGILYDISSEILRRTGLKYNLLPAFTEAEYRALIVNKGVDLRLTARFDYNYAENIGYTLISPYYITDVSRVTRKAHEGEISTLAVVRDSTIDTYYLPTILAGETVAYFSSVEDCVRAVLGGECDAMYLYTRTAQQVVYADVTNRLTSVIMPKFSVNFTIGVREDADARLASILEKATASLSEDDIEAYVLKYTNYNAPPITLLGLFYNNPIIMLVVVALMLVMVFAGIILLIIAHKRKLEREQNLKLQAALVSAEQANNAKSVFMSRMSHEIRTPLNAIIGYNSISAGALNNAKNETEFKQAAMRAMDCLTKCDIASKQLLSVINDVLDMSAIESGKLKIAREPFDFNNLISSLSIMFYAQASAKGVDFSVDIDKPVDEWYVGDSMRLSQILTNLLSNAVKFTHPGGSIKLIVRLETFDERAARMRFEVADTGIGMDTEFMAHIFEPFEQADASISRRFGGTGLGLSIVKSLVDIMGGDIRVSSGVGEGSVFTVKLAFERMAQPDFALSDASGEFVLIVDDDKSTCDYIKLLFDRAGARSTAVTSGEQAIAAVNAGIQTGDGFTVCLVDLNMPGMDGMATVKSIRAIAGPEVPIIVISAYDFSEYEQAAREIGVDSFVSKPLFQSTVVDLLANIRGKRGVSAEITPGKHDFGGARVLIAEDNQMNMEIAKAILCAWNLRVDEARDGKEAVDMFMSAPVGAYKAILMDVHMPEMDGYRATRAIRASARPEAKTLPILAMTADVFAEDVAEATKAGMNAHIAKPIDRNTLLDTLLRFIN